MPLIKKIAVVIAILFFVIQFIQPDFENKSQAVSNDISKVFHIPENIISNLQNACYDCHSNVTIYPWYSHLQPIGWFLQNDIIEGRNKLNFNEFKSYSNRRRISKLIDIEKRIEDGSMPIKSYSFLHPTARLTLVQKQEIINFIESIANP